MLNFLQRLRNWFLADLSKRIENLEKRSGCLENAIREIREENKSRSRTNWQAVSALGTWAGALLSAGALGFSLYMLRTVYADSRRASRVDVRAREIEHEARARIDLVRTNSTNDIFTVMNYGKIPIENGKLFIRYFKVQGTSGNTVTTYFSDLGRFHPNDPQPVLILSPMKAGPEPPLEFAMAQIRGNQTFMETKPFQTEVFIWLFYQRREWVKESEKLGNITNLQQRSIISNAIEQFRSIK